MLQVADRLIERGIRIVFTTGYDENVIPPRYADVPRCGKPVTRLMLRRMLDGERPGGPEIGKWPLLAGRLG